MVAVAVVAGVWAAVGIDSAHMGLTVALAGVATGPLPFG